VNFWDASAVLPLVVRESSSASLHRLAARERDHVVWWGTAVECDSAISRLWREGRLAAEEVGEIQESLDSLLDSWASVEPSEAVRSAARRLLRNHPLRAGDALQLGAAVTAAEGRAETISFVCLDERLREAARREGLRLLPAPGRKKARV
jgi:predicted nucleic acid-binding protein